MSDLNRMDSLFNKNNSSKLSAAFDETGVEMESNVDLLQDDWTYCPEELLDSIISMNGDLLTEIDDPNQMDLNDFSTNFMLNQERISPISSEPEFNGFGSDLDQSNGLYNGDTNYMFNMYNQIGENDIGYQDKSITPINDKQSLLSSGASDSGLSTDHLDLDMNPDYEALSPAMSSPGPSISERGGQNSPPRCQTVYMHSINNDSSSLASTSSSSSLSTPVTSNHITLDKNVRKTINISNAKILKRGHVNVEKNHNTNAKTLSFKHDQIIKQKTIAIKPQTKEVKIIRMNPNKLQNAKTLNGGIQKIINNSNNKKVTIQLKSPVVKQQIQLQKEQHTLKTITIPSSQANAVTASMVLNKNQNLTGVRKLIRVQNTSANNPRSILLPVSIQDIKDFRTIKIVNASNLKGKSPNIKLAAANLLQQSKQGLVQKNVMVTQEELIDDSISETNSDSESFVFEDVMQQSENVIAAAESMTKDSDDYDEDLMDDYDNDDNDDSSSNNGKSEAGYPKLVLTSEEKRLLVKEGISLPTNYPLTKHEERELKRIRRKIRNKISAQDSRKRKKEYVDGLEERVKQCTDENLSLLKRIKLLQSQNNDLVSQMKKLQLLLTKGTSKTAQPATCLMVLLLSMALVAVPNLKLSHNNADKTDIASELADAVVQQRNLLFDNKEQCDILSEEDDIMQPFNDDNDKCVPSMQKRIKTFVDYDVDDVVSTDYKRHNLDPMGVIKSEAKNSDLFKRESNIYQENLKNIQSSGFNIKTEINDLDVEGDILEMLSRKSRTNYDLYLDKMLSLSETDNLLSENGINVNANTNVKLNASQQIQTKQII